jgi:hypothetical protein
MMQPVIAAAELLCKASSMNTSTYGGGAGAPPSGYRSTAATLAAAGRQLSAANTFPNQQLQFYQQHQQPSAAMGSPWRSLGRIDSRSEDALAAAVAAAGLAPPPPPPPYSNTASSLNRASTATAQQLLYQQQLQQAALARSLSVDVGMMAGAGGYLGGGAGAGGRWGGGRLPYDVTGFGGHEQQGRFGSVYDMKRCESQEAWLVDSLLAAVHPNQLGRGCQHVRLLWVPTAPVLLCKTAYAQFIRQHVAAVICRLTMCYCCGCGYGVVCAASLPRWLMCKLALMMCATCWLPAPSGHACQVS